MELEQSLDLTYVKLEEMKKKLDELDENVESVYEGINGETLNTINSKVDSVTNVTNTIKTNIDNLQGDVSEIKENANNNSNINEIKTNVDDIKTSIETIKTSSENLGTIKDDVTNIKSDITELKSNVITINANSTTTNSNTATIKNNVDNIKTGLDKITSNIANREFGNEVIQKLDEILKNVSLNNNQDTFEEDPYKLDLEYTTKLEQHRNPTNKVHLEFNNQFQTKKFIYRVLAHCEDNVASFKIKINYTSSIDTYIWLTNYQNSEDYDLPAGTNANFELELKNQTLTNNKLHFILQFMNNNQLITINSISIDLEGNNIYVPETKKYKINHSSNHLIITKVENNNGYYLDIDKKNALTPSILKQNYVLSRENVIDYDRIYDVIMSKNKWFSLNPVEFYINYQRNIVYDNANNYKSYETYNYLYDKVAFGYTASKIYASTIWAYWGNKANWGLLNPSESQTYFNESNGYFKEDLTANCAMVCEPNRFDYLDRSAFIVETIDGMNYFYLPDKCNIEVGYGKFATAFYDKDNALKINIYMNDNGYCVKKVLLLNDEKTSATIVSQRIIGTYDAYFETSSNVYFVEKNKKLYMYKN